MARPPLMVCRARRPACAARGGGAPFGSFHHTRAMTTPMPPAADAVSKNPDARSRYLDAYRREVATTEEVLRAFPADKADCKPHERSSSAHGLAFTFVVESAIALKVLNGEQIVGGKWPTPPEKWEEVLAAFDEVTKQHE